ncbi:cache domain-containing sensor histidine kinase [Paenibacillus alba]|uniref:Sensor histidine kinase n=1 Tax=Paenibacillus alba TaxID=1197127 RepID=A0ABU6GEB1_9BACL|nr:sensor histidine kinase [Paenibacillus alba]MEC0232564.1 sensor histidine kinase [Paenibacillus alba]
MSSRKLFLSLRMKFIILFFLLITIPFFFSGWITYKQYSRNVENDAIAYTKQIIDQITINLDRYMKDMDRLTLAPYYDNNVIDILRTHVSSDRKGSFVKSDEAAKMNLMISSLAIDRSELQSITIFTNDGIIFSNLQETIARTWQPADNPWIKDVIDADGGLIIIPPHKASYYIEQNREVVSIARVIRAGSTNEHLGIVKIDLSEMSFQKILASASFSRNSRIYVTDRHGRQLYPLHGQVELTSTGNTISFEGGTFITATKQSDYTGMFVTGLIPQDDMKAGARELIRSTFLISLVSILVAYFIAGIASSGLIKPIRHLQVKMKKVKKGDFRERAVVTTHDEIGQLTEGFNDMVMEIERLVKEVYESKLREREAEFYALQSQINPHFIYNTLESINTLALQSYQYEVSNVVVNLGRLLRYTVDKEQKYVHLRDEISFVEAYLEIQSSRLGIKLKTEFYIEIGHDYLLIPKLILQPLVENVIEHALTEETVTVHISTRLEQKDLIIVIEDDGMGMSAERKEYVEKHMYAEQNVTNKQRFVERKKEFALRNVHRRLYVLYGEGYGLFIDKTTAKGTTFWLRMPLIYEEEN